MGNGDGCSSMCKWEARIAFVTSTKHTGNLGGLVGADAICNMRAQAAGLPGTYMAWISTNLGTPNSRFLKSTVPYVSTGFAIVADNWTDLADGSLDTPIQFTESGAASVAGPNCIFNGGDNFRTARTGTFSNGLIATNTCSNFTSGTNGFTANVGVTTSNAGRWSNTTCSNGLPTCDVTMPVYCFQQ
jgi:hypothetical protein